MSKCKTECGMEYITKEQALEAIRGKMWPGELEAAIKAIPAADVAPVVRAKWKRISSYDEDRNADFMCINCGAGDRHAIGVEVPRCWKCGAIMSGEECKEETL